MMVCDSADRIRQSSEHIQLYEYIYVIYGTVDTSLGEVLWRSYSLHKTKFHSAPSNSTYSIFIQLYRLHNIAPF